MVEKIAPVVLELHQGGGGHANTTRCQHQAEATASDREGEEKSTGVKVVRSDNLIYFPIVQPVCNTQP